jgi:hypothetical protein
MILNRTVALLVLVVLGLCGLQAETIKLKAKPGSKVRIDGTSTVHDWTVEGSLIGGSVEVNGPFPTKAGQVMEPGAIDVQVKAFIPITSLRSVKDGKPYSTKMDEIMHEKLGKPTHKMIQYELDKLSFKSAPEAAGGPYVFDSEGRLIVAGATNALAVPVEVLPMEDGKVKFTTQTAVKMTDFGIEPPAPKIALGMIKTGDEVDISIEWMTAEVPAK